MEIPRPLDSLDSLTGRFSLFAFAASFAARAGAFHCSWSR